MKKIIRVTLSQHFPQVHPNAGEPTYFRHQLENEIHNYDSHIVTVYPSGEDLFIDGRKKHTIRNNYCRWQHNLDKINAGQFRLSVRMWEAKPFRSKQEEILSLDHVGYQQIELDYDPTTENVEVLIDGRPYTGGIEEIAKNDGLSARDFKDWFFSSTKTHFSGIIMHFTDFRY
ncbi:MAG: hypothetical protein SNI70_10745 [Rikenellaceae bacterium]